MLAKGWRFDTLFTYAVVTYFLLGEKDENEDGGKNSPSWIYSRCYYTHGK